MEGQHWHIFKSQVSVGGIFEGDHKLLVVINVHFSMFFSTAKTCHACSSLGFGGLYISPPPKKIKLNHAFRTYFVVSTEAHGIGWNKFYGSSLFPLKIAQSKAQRIFLVWKAGFIF